jgi:uncharacterized protein HemX
MPPLSDAAVFIAVFTAVATLIGGGFATYQQLRKDRRQAAVEIAKLQEDVERALWDRVRGELADMAARLDRQAERIAQQDATINEQGAVIMQMREQIRQLELDRNHWRARALEAERTRGKRL